MGKSITFVDFILSTKKYWMEFKTSITGVKAMKQQGFSYLLPVKVRLSLMSQKNQQHSQTFMAFFKALKNTEPFVDKYHWKKKIGFFILG